MNKRLMQKTIGLSVVSLTAAMSVVTSVTLITAACSDGDGAAPAPTTYTVTLDANGGLFGDGAATVTKSVETGGYITDIQNPSRENYVFYGWLANSDDAVAVDLSTLAIESDVTYYAGWKRAVNISFYYNYEDAPNGGVYLSDVLASGSLIVEPAAPTREGYTFDCWTTDAEGNSVWEFSADRAMNAVQLYAQWLQSGSGDEQTLHTVTLHVGEHTEERIVSDNSALTRPEDPVMDGYDFVEWRLGSLSGSAYDFDTLITSDIDLYAYFVEEGHEVQNYTVTLHIGDDIEEHTVTENSAFTRPEDPVADGYEFVEWRLGSLDGEAYDFDTIITSNIDLYAYFTEEGHEEQSYTVTLHIGDDTEEYTVTENSAFIRPEDPTMTGYDFIEWRLGSLTGAAYDFDADVTEDIDLYAYFEEALPDNEHRIIYILDDGTGVPAQNAAENKSVFTEGVEIALHNPSLADVYKGVYTFAGWYFDSDFTDKASARFVPTQTSDITLYAKWEYNYMNAYFVIGKHNSWMNFSSCLNDEQTKSEYVFYPFTEDADGTWDGKTYIAKNVYLEKGTASNGGGIKIVNKNAEFGVNGNSGGAAAIEVPETGYYTIKIKSVKATQLEPPELSWASHTVSFDTGSSEFTIDDEIFGDGLTITAPTIKGYVVDKWYRDAAKTIEWNFASDILTEDITLYAGEFSRKKVEIEYGSYNHLFWTAALVTEVEYGTAINLAYTLDTGYNQSQITVYVNGVEASGTTYTVDTEAKIRITATGIEKNKYTVTFNQADGTEISKITVEHGEDVTPPEPTAITGKRHTGWSGSTENITESKTLTAVYEWIDYTVTFYPNGGSSVAAMTAHYGEKITKPQDPEKVDMELEGWYTDSRLTSKWDFDSNTMPASNITLYANWKRNENINWYKVDYKRHKDDAEAYNSVEISENGALTVPTDPILDGFTFVKWFDATTDREYTFGNKLTSDITLYATWSLKAPTVTLDNVSGEYRPAGYTLTAKPSHELSDVEYTYKWFKNGAEISGATSATFVVTSVADSGEYSVEVTAISDGLTATATATATADIQKTTLPTIAGIQFKDGDAYNCAITFNADTTTAATYYELNIYDAEGTTPVYTKRISTGDTKEFAIDAPIKGEYTVEITYAGLTSETDVQNTSSQETLNFKGLGTVECPFDVGNVTELKRVANHPHAHFIQTADITVTKVSQLTALFTSSSASFNGVYDGNGKTVKGITDGRGLFGYIGTNGAVKNLTVDVTLSSAEFDYMGGVAADNGGHIIGVTVSGSIENKKGSNTSSRTSYGTGGIVGKNSGVIDTCVSTAKVVGKTAVGGIAGYNLADAEVLNCENTGAIGATDATMSCAGGLVGYNGGKVSRSKNTAAVNAQKGTSNVGNKNDNIAGLVGENISGGTVSECLNTGAVKCDYGATGLVSKNSGIVQYCINTGDANARWTASGGSCEGTGKIIQCVLTGKVTADGSYSGGGTYAVVKDKDGTAEKCYYVNGTKPTGTDNGKYETASIEYVVGMLAALGDKFAYDGSGIVLAYTVTANSVVFSADGKTAYMTLNVAAGTVIDLTKITSPTAPANCYFAGWYVQDDAQKTHVTEHTVSSDIRFVADMAKNSYKISFDANGGSEVDDITAEYDEEITAPTPSKTGYKFVGWYEVGAETAFNFKVERNSDVTLIAHWTANPYTLYFDANGGSVTLTEKGITFDGKYGELPTPTRSGYKFIGWYSQKGEDGTDVGWGAAVTANTSVTLANDVTVYAKWEAVSQKVVLDYNYADSPEAHEIGVANSDTEIAINVISRVGYTLKGFATSADGEAEYTAKLTKEQFDAFDSDEVTLYAVWEVIEYTVTVELVGGSWGDGISSLTFTVEDLTEDGYYSIPSDTAPARNGYKFIGWKITRNGADAEHIELSDDYTISAKWEAVKHTIELSSSEYHTVDAAENKIEFTVESGTIALPNYDSVKVGDDEYGFNGWIIDDGDVPFTSLDVSALEYSGDAVKTVTLKQVWEKGVFVKSEAELLALFKGKDLDQLNALKYELRVVDQNDPLHGIENVCFISTSDDLTNLSKSNAVTTYYYQTSDITGITVKNSLFTSSSKPFEGVYNGNGHSIKTVTATSGLFGFIGESGTVKNLTVDVNISGSSVLIGGIAQENVGNILYVTVTGNITGSNQTTPDDSTIAGKAGIVGYNKGTVDYCENQSKIGSDSAAMAGVGGLVGYNDGKITHSINRGSISVSTSNANAKWVGGIACLNSPNGIVSECINYGALSGRQNITGLVTRNKGTVEYCINEGTVKGYQAVSGGTFLGGGIINNCLLLGDVSKSNGANQQLYAVASSDTPKNCCYKEFAGMQDTAKLTADGSNNTVYDETNIDGMLEVLGDKFGKDENNKIVLKFTVKTSA